MPETVGKAMLECYKLGAMGLLIQGYDPQPDAVRYGEELNLARLRLVADYDAASRALSVKMHASRLGSRDVHLGGHHADP